MSFARKELGHGVGLRTPHYPAWLSAEGQPEGIDWLEAITENFLGGGRPLHVLESVRRDRPLVLHGVSLSIGGTDPLDRGLLLALRRLDQRLSPAYVSDHLCWGTFAGSYAHDLLPLPYTEEALAHVVSRVVQVQELLGRQILLENVSSYVEFCASALTEWEFLAQVAQRADCGILLDLNNIFVSAHNHGYDPLTYLSGIPADRVGQFHLAGHSQKDGYLLDTHDHPVPDPVWELYRVALQRFGPVPALIEWDDQVPSLCELAAESHKARALEARVLARPKAALADARVAAGSRF